MKNRKTKEIKNVLQQKGFVLEPSKGHHNFYYLKIDGKKHAIYTYLSHGLKEYSPSLMAQMKKQLKFKETQKAEDFFAQGRQSGAGGEPARRVLNARLHSEHRCDEQFSDGVRCG